MKMNDTSSQDDLASLVSDDHMSQALTADSATGRSGDSSTGSIGREETQAVRRSKLLVVGVLVLAAVLIGTLTCILLSNEERNDFESQFADYSVEISELVNHEANNVFLAVQALATTATSFALERRSPWPYIAIPHFEVKGIQSNELAKSLTTIFCPLVGQEDRIDWEAYSTKSQHWIDEGIAYNIELRGGQIEEKFKALPISEEIFRLENDKRVRENDDGLYLPVWQIAPAPDEPSMVNYNLLSHPLFSRMFHETMKTGQPVLSEVTDLEFLYGSSLHETPTHPHSFLLQPVFSDFLPPNDPNNIVGYIVSILPWDNYFMDVAQQEAQGIYVVLSDASNNTFTYLINGPNATYLGPGDLHDPTYDEFVMASDFCPNQRNASLEKECEFLLKIYPSEELENVYKTVKPAVYTFFVIMVFFFTSLVFILYDYYVQRRQERVVATAKRSNAIVSSLFPSNVRDRIMKEAEEAHDNEHGDKNGRFTAAKKQLKSFLDEDNEDNAATDIFGSKPIADLFPDATVLFADIVGFTAWSSVREPSQVFQLLETLYHAFDEIAKRRRVFKVETIGDCYVAVTGLPEPRADHAVAMTRFARDILSKTNDLSKKLECSLGPDTGDLCMRIGMNSGPVTAGVLRGEKSRFQLFGDTVNTAARVESNGERNRIHCSSSTAELLIASGKSDWVTLRKEKVFAKGKGDLQTYWVDLKIQSAASVTSNSTNGLGTRPSIQVESFKDEPASVSSAQTPNTSASSSEMSAKEPVQEMKRPLLTDKIERLVSWNCDVLKRLLKQVVARRNATGRKSTSSSADLDFQPEEGATILDEVKEIITLPLFDAKAAKKQESPNAIILHEDVSAQLHDFVTIIATMYRENPFHNFEHASHVTMSVVKLLSRIVSPVDYAHDDDADADKNMHDHTYGITSDPLTQFAVVFAALIHDVDHSGVPNAQLVKEKCSIAAVYKNKSVAEQNSVDIAWDLLMDSTFDTLRSVIYTNESELKRFRQLIINAVMATDIVDKELKELRNARWEKAFQPRPDDYEETRDDVNRKATIVIEHLIQASDVAHTMQHWHIYRKWNERFFQENIEAYKAGRAEKDPTEFWYKGEIGFFDFYIIPLAKKLKDCGVFGVSSDEYLNYALANRKEWEIKGEEVVAEMAAKYQTKKFEYNEDQNKLGEEKKKLDDKDTDDARVISF